MTRMEDRKENFSDIIDRPHPTSAAHRPMPLQDRAAQFSPFAALAACFLTYKYFENSSAMRSPRSRTPFTSRTDDRVALTHSLPSLLR